MAKFGFLVRSPVAYMEFPETWSEREIRDFYDQFGEGIRSGRIRGEVWDLTRLNPFFSNATQRKLAAECVKKIAPLLPGRMVAAGRVVPNAVTRGLVTAVDWLVGQYEHPVQNFAKQADAEQFVIGKLLAAGIPVPDSARFYTLAKPEAQMASGLRR